MKRAPAFRSRCVAPALAAACLVAISGCAKSAPSAPPEAPPAAVSVTKAVTKTLPVETTTFGTVMADNSVAVKALVAGQMTSVSVVEGQDVRKGDLLLTIDPLPFQSALAQAEAALKKDQAQLKNSQVELARYSDMQKKGFASLEQVDAFRAQVGVFEASIEADRAAIDEAKLNLGYCYIRSPVDGVFGRLLIDPGNIIKANDVPIVVINQVEPIDVSVSLREQDFGRLRAAMAAGPVRVSVIIPGDKGPAEEGVIYFVDNAVDTATATLLVKARFDNKARRLWPGQFVRVAIVFSLLENAVVVPADAVVPGQQGTHVFVVKADGTVDERAVTVALTVGADAAIEKGVEVGETVVTDGQVRLTNGSRVEVRPSPQETPQ